MLESGGMEIGADDGNCWKRSRKYDAQCKVVFDAIRALRRAASWHILAIISVIIADHAMLHEETPHHLRNANMPGNQDMWSTLARAHG